MFQNWITKETISRLILPNSKIIEGAFALEFYKMLNSNNSIGNIILEENIKGINFSLMLNKYINKYNYQIFGYHIKT